MTISIRLYGPKVDGVASSTAQLLEDLSGAPPNWSAENGDELRRVDPATILGIATLVLSLPGVALTALQIREHLGRTRLVSRIDAWKTQLEETDTEAELRLDGKTVLDLRRTSPDKLADFLMKDG